VRVDRALRRALRGRYLQKHAKERQIVKAWDINDEEKSLGRPGPGLCICDQMSEMRLERRRGKGVHDPEKS